MSVFSALASVSNFRFALQAGYFDSFTLRKLLLHTWSLAVEEQFYLMWPLLLKLIHTHQHRLSRLLAVPAIALLALMPELCTRRYPSFAYFLAPVRFYELLIGASLHLVAPPPYNSPPSDFLLCYSPLVIFRRLRAFPDSRKCCRLLRQPLSFILHTPPSAKCYMSLFSLFSVEFHTALTSCTGR